MYIVSNFRHDVREWGWRVAVNNARFLIGSAILPGNHKHISVRYGDEKECDRCAEDRDW